MMTTQKMQVLTGKDFHEAISQAYEMIDFWNNQIASNERWADKMEINFGHDNGWKRKGEIKKSARDRVAAWIEKQIKLRYEP